MIAEDEINIGLNYLQFLTIVEKPIDCERLLKLVREVPLPNDFKTKKQVFFRTLNLKPSSKGTTYLSDAVDIAHTDASRMDSMNSIYDIVSAKRKVPASKVKWSIRNTIKRLNRVAPKEYLENVLLKI